MIREKQVTNWITWWMEFQTENYHPDKSLHVVWDVFLLNDTSWGWCLITVNSPNAICIQSLGRPQHRFTPTRKSYEVASEKESERETSIARISVSFSLNWFSQAVCVAACLRKHFSKSYHHSSPKNSFKKSFPMFVNKKLQQSCFNKGFNNSQAFCRFQPLNSSSDTKDLQSCERQWMPWPHDTL